MVKTYVFYRLCHSCKTFKLLLLHIEFVRSPDVHSPITTIIHTRILIYE